MSQTVVKSTNLKKFYGYNETRFQALKDINLEIEEGEFICIMGPSGAGKSTLLNLLSTIDIPYFGYVHINGVNVKSMSETKLGNFRYENLGFIFQEFHLIPTLTIAENIAIPLTLANVDQSYIDQRVLEVATSVGIEKTLHKYPNECSGGQIQRAAVARALVTKPKLLIADEPTGNLDSHNSHEILNIFRRMNVEDHATIIMVTHDSTIASYSSRVVRIVDGEIDTILERKDLTQKEFFYKIVEANSQNTHLDFMEED